MNSDWQRKNVLVTGSGTGIGREITLEFGRRGANIALHYAHDQETEGIQSALAELKQLGSLAHAYFADFTDLSQATRLVRQAMADFGPDEHLDVVINNAGITLNVPFRQCTPDQFDILVNVNLRALFFITQVALDYMVSNGGSIINLSSVHAFAGKSGHSIYAMTKTAIVGLTRQLSIELAPFKIRVNAIAPGWIETENQHKVMDFDARKEGAKVPAGFLGQPLDVAKAVVWLSSEEARYFTGQTFIQDGGMTSWLAVDEGWRDVSTAPFGRPYVLTG